MASSLFMLPFIVLGGLILWFFVVFPTMWFFSPRYRQRHYRKHYTDVTNLVTRKGLPHLPGVWYGVDLDEGMVGLFTDSEAYEHPLSTIHNTAEKCLIYSLQCAVGEYERKTGELTLQQDFEYLLRNNVIGERSEWKEDN